MSLRPSMTNIKHRLSHIFVSGDATGYSFNHSVQYSSDSNLPINHKSGKPDPYWRPLPFILDEADEKLLQFVKNEKELIDVVCETTVVYHTNLPTLHKACKTNMPNHIEIIAPASHPTTSIVTHNSAYISRIKNEIVLELKGLEPVKFYRAKPDCLFPVDCFTARKATNRDLFSNVDREKDLTIDYAWKHTSMVGKGGLKLVDLRDNEVLAYYIPTVGKSFAKIRLQGSGLASQRLVVSTILALKYRAFLAEKRIASSKTTFAAPNSVASTRPSETETACEVPVGRHSFAATS
ncbi:protein of unknown function [Taphrina deformans PYCC 5710]|uniref:Uncharacterized protein n=1 Tax=Taphrina deformans (strain PYCC 5710 / ATCC 11124 / CBS 356.35 / IMI 108563 / JCM 9778 / NBRC 8474) TaxID=1097556 RepID=R4XCU1_TAPDE|nr:protein of unknown function [Taphrina deformans PYCC 5710]|eukprot:CCG83438.1 protein of unknown function [Taphrina deformans PYCC 5710]